MTALGTHFRSDISIQANASEVRRASEWMAQHGTEHGVPADQMGRLDLCLNEALANVIAHAYSGSESKPITLTLEVSDCAQAAVTVTDEGPAFDMASAPLPERPQTLADAEPGGLGLMMIRSFSDEVAYRRVDGKNELTFRVRWG